MDTLARLSKKHQLSRICRIGTWIIAVIGVIQVGLLFYNAWHIYLQTLDVTQQIPVVVRPTTTSFLGYLPNVLTGIPLYLFLGILLYCASVIFEAVEATTVAHQAESTLDEHHVSRHDLEDEGIIYTPLPPEEARQSKKTAWK